MINVKRLIDISDENIEKLLTSLGLEYKYENDWIVCRCPFHNGNDFNFKYRDKSWYCFSQCQRGYSTIDVVQKVMDLDFKDAIKWMCNVLNISDSNLKIDEKKIEVKSKLMKLKSMKTKKEIVEHKPIPQDILNDIEQFNHPYMLQQGFNKKTLEHFDIGYARSGFFANRITFPIDAPDGSIMSISGRLPNADKLGLPKYKILNGSDKADTLYNISRVNKDLDYIVVVEGFKSVMSLYEWGIENSVATMGASLSRNQLLLLLGLGKKIICIGDNDSAGKRMMQSVYNQCYRFSEVYRIDLSEFTDIDKASPCESDIGFDSMSELIDKICEVIDND